MILKKRVIIQHYTSLMNSSITGFCYSVLLNYKYVCTAQAPDVFLLVYSQLQHKNYFKQDLTLLVSEKNCPQSDVFGIYIWLF